MRTRALALAICALVALGVVAGALQVDGAPGQANAAVLEAGGGSCGPTSTMGSTHTAGGAALMIAAGLDKLTNDSDRIVAGTVTSFRTCVDRESGGVSTDVTVRVTEHVKAAPGSATPDAVASPSDVTFNVPGGQFGQLALYVGTSPEFAIGEQVIVFLQDADGELRLTAGYQGKFSVAPNGEVAGWGEAAFTLNGVVWSSDDIPVQYYVNAAEGKPAQLSAADAQTAWSNAFNTWQDDAGSDISFSLQGTTTRDSGDDQCGPAFPDGFNDLTWGISIGHDASVLAITFTCASVQPGPDLLLDADIEFDSDAGHFLNDWRTDGTGACNSGLVDLESVTLHETGHFLGLTHPTFNGCGANGGCPVMNASYQGVKRSLCQDDQDGVASLYPAAVTPTATSGGPPTNTPTNTNTPTIAPPTNTPTNTNTPTVAPPTNTPTNTNTPTVAPPTSTPTNTNTPTVAPPTNTPTDTQAPSATPAPATDTPTGAATSTDTPEPTETSTSTPTEVAPTATPTAQPSDAPTETPTPTSTPTRTATRTPTRTPTRTATHAPPPASTTGDANCDGRKNSLDALAILQLSAGLVDSLTCEDEADVNGNGRVDALDAALVLQFVAGLVGEL